MVWLCQKCHGNWTVRTGELIIDSGNRRFINIDYFVDGKNREGQNKAKSATVCKNGLQLVFCSSFKCTVCN